MPRYSAKTKSKIFFLIAIILSASVLTTILLYDTQRISDEIEYNLEVDASTTLPTTATMRNATPYMALADSSMGYEQTIGDWRARSSIDGEYWNTGGDDGEPTPFFEQGIFSPESWMGSDLSDVWNMKYLLGTTREVTEINIQFGDLYTYGSANNLGIKKYRYDLTVLNDDGFGNKQQVTIASNVPNIDPNDHSWTDELFTSANTDVTLANPLGAIGHTTTGVGTRYVVADGSDNEVKVFNINGIYQFDIYGDDSGFGIDWKADNKIVVDVAEMPKQTGTTNNWKGGYMIALSDGTLWHSEFGETRLDHLNDALESSGEFLEITQIATDFSGTDYFDLYVLEKSGSSSYTLFHYYLEVTINGIFFSKSDYIHSISLSTSVGALEVTNGAVYVVDQTAGNIRVYDKSLNFLGVISSGTGYGKFTVPQDIGKSNSGNNIVILDSTKLIGWDYNRSQFVGEATVLYNGVSPSVIGTQGSSCIVLSSQTTQLGKIMKETKTILNNAEYFDWDRFEITENLISEYQVRIYGLKMEWNPFGWIPDKVGVPTIPGLTSLEGWNRPLIVETLYWWEYDSDFDGIQVELITPADGENFIAFGTQGSYDIEFDVRIAESDAYPTGGLPYQNYPIAFELDTALRTIDTGVPEDVESFRKTNKLTLGSGFGSVVTQPILAPATDIYKFKTRTSTAYIKDGDTWDIYLDGNYIHTFEEDFVEGSIDDDFPLPPSNDLFCQFITRGSHEIEFRHISGISQTLPTIYAEYDVWAQEGIPLSEDSHDITIWVNDTNGFEDEDSANFQVITFPFVNISSPGQDIGYNTNVTLIFEVEDSNLDSAWYELNGIQRVMLTYPENATDTNKIRYEEEIDVLDMIPNDVNQITIMANDTQGHLSFGSRTFFVDFNPPEITFPFMENNTFIPNNNTYYINITDNTFLNAYYTINDNGVQFDINEGLNILEILSYEFGEGINNLTVWAFDLVGNNATAYLNLSKDEANPIINVTAPKVLEKFFNDLTPDPIPLLVEAYDSAINTSLPIIYAVKETSVNDYLRFHFGSYEKVSQSIISSNYSLTDFSLRARGFGRLKISVYEDRLLLDDPISVGYIDVSDQINFQWYNADMSNTRVLPDATYYVEIETITPFNDIFVSISNNAYKNGSMTIKGIPRPHWDLTFKWGHKPIINNTKIVDLWFNVNGQHNSLIATNGTYDISDLKDFYTFNHGYNYINIFAEDEAGNMATKIIKIQYIDTTITTQISVELTSQQDQEWVFSNTTITWDSSVPDHTDRVSFETYTHDIYLISVNLSIKVKAGTFIDVNEGEINTSLVVDGYYFIEINSTDGTTEDVDQSNLIRVLNGAPIITIDDPQSGEYINNNTRINISVICPDIIDVFYRYDLGINNSVVEVGDWDFFNGYQFFFTITPDDVADGQHTLDVFIKDSINRTEYDFLLFTMDTVTDITLDEMGIQSSTGYILIEYDAPYDAEIINLVIEDENGIVINVNFKENNITGQYIIAEGLPTADYLIIISITDRAGNIATDTEGFSVQQSVLVDIIEDIFEFFGAILGLFALASGIAAVLFMRKNKKNCEIYGGRFCEI